MTVNALGVDLANDLGMGVVGVLNDGSLRSIGLLEVDVGEALRKDMVSLLRL